MTSILVLFPIVSTTIIAVLWYSTTRTTTLVSKPLLKCYFSYWFTVWNWIVSFWLVGWFRRVDSYTMWYLSARWYGTESLLMVVVVVVSCFVIINGIDYISFMESYLFLLLISIFQFTMICFIVSTDLITAFLLWDWLGLISFWLVNFWSSKTNSGIKAVIYNKIGDVVFLLLVSYSYSFVSLINNSMLLPATLLVVPGVVGNYLYSNSYSSILLLLFLFSKSAQLPFSSWLLNAMSAPTPISALLHSSTMVVAGVYLGVVLHPVIIVVIDNYSFLTSLLVIVPSSTMIWSLFRGKR